MEVIIITNKKKMDILNDITFIVDTRENKWHHIKDFLEENNIPYIVQKLDVGDYSFYLPNYPELNMDNKIIVERKSGLSELAGNFTSGRERFKREFERMEEGQKVHLLVETATWRKLFNGSYRSSFTPKAYRASLLSWSIKYNLPVWFAETKESPQIIYDIFYYELRNYLNDL